MNALKELAEHLQTQLGEAEQSARLYREAAARCALLRGGVQRSLDAVRSMGGDAELELYLLGQIEAAAKAEATNLREAESYEAKSAQHRMAQVRVARLVVEAP